MKHVIASLILGVALTGCATAPQPSQPETPPEVPAGEQRIDYIGLEQQLHLDRPIENVGYVEKAFDTCSAGRGFSHSSNCHKEFFVSIHFQLQCRETEEPPPGGVDPSDIHPIGDRTVTWLLQKKQGAVQTDPDGYGQIRMTYRNRPGEKQIKLSTNGQFLYVQASDLSKIVTPPKWCQ
jgi:hypothetical protein